MIRRFALESIINPKCGDMPILNLPGERLKPLFVWFPNTTDYVSPTTVAGGDMHFSG